MRPVATDDARVAALAAEQFHEHGITATGVDALSRAAGISKRTLYQRFGIKDGLIVAAYDALDLPVFRMLTENLASGLGRPAAGARGILRPACHARAACRSSAAARSRTRQPSSPTRRTRPTRSCGGTRRGSGAGSSAGHGSPALAEPEQLASRLMLLFAGVQAQSLVDRSDRPAREARALAAELIATATNSSGA